MRPIYNATFNLGEGGPADPTPPKLEEIKEEVKGWINTQYNLGIQELPLKETINGKTLETITITHEATRMFGFEMSHPDREKQDIIWKVSICAKETPHDYPLVSVTLSNGSIDNVMRTVPQIVSRPTIVPNLIKKFGAHQTHGISVDPYRLNTEDVEFFVQEITDTTRTLPIVYITKERLNGYALINPKKTASLLAGIAQVHFEDHPDTSFELKKQFDNKEIGFLHTFNGAVRIYQPNPQGIWKTTTHPLYMPEEIMRLGSLENHLFEKISSKTITRIPPITIEDIRRIEAEDKRKKINELGEMVEVANDYANEHGALKAKIDLQKTDIDNLKARVQMLEEENQGLSNTVRSYNGSGPRYQLKTTQDAVELFESLYPSQGVLFLPKAKNMAKRNLFKDPERVFKALQWLATTYRNTKQGIIKCPDLNAICQEQAGMEYKGGQNPTTVGMYEEDYYAQWNGKTIPLEEHLSYGGKNRDKTRLIRIAFYHDKPTNTVVVGYIESHQTNRST